jgi:hypothetical protein
MWRMKMSKEEYASFVTLAHKITEWLVHVGRAIRGDDDAFNIAKRTSAEVVDAINAMEGEE